MNFCDHENLSTIRDIFHTRIDSERFSKDSIVIMKGRENVSCDRRASTILTGLNRVDKYIAAESLNRYHDLHRYVAISA